MKAGSPALVNAAARQPMLAERIARLYAQVGRGVLAPRAQRSLAAALREFDAGSRALLAAAGSPEIRESYRLLELLWVQYRPIVARAPGLDVVDKVLERHEEVAWVAAQGARLVADPRGGSFPALRAAGDARHQSQRIARLHLFRGWGTRSRDLASALRESGEGYRGAIAALRATGGRVAGLEEELQLAANQEGFLEAAALDLEDNPDPRPALESVAKTSDNILEVLERVAKACEAAEA